MSNLGNIQFIHMKKPKISQWETGLIYFSKVPDPKKILGRPDKLNIRVQID